MEVLVEWRDQMCLSTKKVRVPNTQKATNDWNILLQWGLQEMLIHSLTASKELLKVLVPNEEADGETDSRPDRVTPTNPRFETKHICRVYAKLFDLFLVSGQCNEMLGNVLFCGRFEEPGLSSVGVGGGFGSSEGLRCNQEESGLRI